MLNWLWRGQANGHINVSNMLRIVFKLKDANISTIETLLYYMYLCPTIDKLSLMSLNMIAQVGFKRNFVMHVTLCDPGKLIN